ncbi:MAG: hypothetical protein U0325_20680 [Polyangiales bacterium]
MQLSHDEGRCLLALDALLGTTALPARFAVLGADARSSSVLRVGAAHMARASLRWLVHGGGWRERAVLRAGRRARGRAWDATIAGDFALRFTRASLDLWTHGMEVIPALRDEEDAEARRSLRARLRRGGVAKASGDHLLAAMALDARLGLAAADERVRVSALRRMSPLAAALRPDGGWEPAMTAALRVLLGGPDARIVECGQDRLADAWVRAAAGAREAGGRDDATRAWTALGDVLRAWCEVTDGLGRLDLARPAAVALARIVDDLAAVGADGVREHLRPREPVRAIAARDAHYAAARGVLEVGEDLLRRRAVLAQERYGDDRYEESQVFLAAVDATLAPRRATLQGLTRALSSRVG